MEFRILGPLEVYDEGRPLRVSGSKQRALLALLLLHRNEVVSSDRLIDELWGEEPPEAGPNALQARVSQLRKALAPVSGEILLTRAPGYLLRVEPGELDAERFERLAGAGRRVLAQGDAAGAAQTLREALALWGGPALADFTYEPFAQGEIARLEEARLSALEERIEADLALGRHAELVGELQALVAADPLRERLRGQLMLALYRSGRQAEALDAFQETRRSLVEELGIEPSPPLQRLHQAILRQEPELEPPEEAPPPPVAAGETRPAEERKLATALFAELVAPGEPDPERARIRLERFWDAASAEIESAGGTVERFAGSAVTAIFGAPAALEDHGERALHAALSLRSRVVDLFGDAAALRAGAESGEILVARPHPGTSLVAGEAVEVAARLGQAAAPGEILLGSEPPPWSDARSSSPGGKPNLPGSYARSRSPGLGACVAFSRSSWAGRASSRFCRPPIGAPSRSASRIW